MNGVVLTCDCGFKAEGKNHYEAEAMMWHHTIKEHLDILKDMNSQDLEEVIISNDSQMGIKA